MSSYDALPLPTIRPSDALRLLWARFPELSQQFGDPDDPDPETPEPHYSYSLFAEEVLRRKEDKLFLERVCTFINELALSRDSLLEELLATEVLEGLAQDPGMAATLYPKIVPEAQETLRAIEREMYGRA